MIGTGFAVPMTASGRRPPVRLTKLAPICSSGVVTRAIGRLARLASPVKKVGDRVAGDEAHHQAGRRAAVAHVEHLIGFDEAADADSAHAPDRRRRF